MLATRHAHRVPLLTPLSHLTSTTLVLLLGFCFLCWDLEQANEARPVSQGVLGNYISLSRKQVKSAHYHSWLRGQTQVLLCMVSALSTERSLQTLAYI